ncbi:MAG TPA: Hpt domain-containing protein [Chthoniobacteraceae bacterium]|nr:Hpt domain-containing protein [Chthoniobacteraceae bacterium]
MKATEPFAPGVASRAPQAVSAEEEAAALHRFRSKAVRLLKAAKQEAAILRGMNDDLESIRVDQLAMLRREMGGKIDELVRLFVVTTGESLAELQAAAQACDHRRVAALAHRIKGSASNFGAVRMMAICERLETSPAGEAGCEPAALVELLAGEYQLVSRALGR